MSSTPGQMGYLSSLQVFLVWSGDLFPLVHFEYLSREGSKGAPDEMPEPLQLAIISFEESAVLLQTPAGLE